MSTSGGRYVIDNYCCLNGSSSANLPSTWYAFDAGVARFYVLHAAWTNSNVGTASSYQMDHDYHFAPGTPQYEWLQADLASHPSALKFAFIHYPIHSDQAAEASDPWLQGPTRLEGLLADHGVDIAFTGHAHIYQRNRAVDPHGLVTYVTGGGGADVQTIGPCSPLDMYGRGFSDTSGTGNKCGTGPVPTDRAQVFHYLIVSVSGTSVTVTPTDSLGNTFDVVTYDFSTTDTEPPDTPANLRTTSVTADEVGLAWDAAADDVGVTAYELTRDGAPLATVDAPTTTYLDQGVVPGMGYRYAVRAVDAAGNQSAYSPDLVVTTPQAPSTETLTFLASHDATLQSTKPGTNYGNLTALAADGSPVKDFLLRFDVSGVGEREVQSATLHMRVVDPSNSGGTFSPTTSAAWNEATVTWSNAPPAGLQSVGSIGAVTAGTTYTLDVTSVVSGDGPLSLRAKSSASNGVDYASSEAGPTVAPRLEVVVSTAPVTDTNPPDAPANLRATGMNANHVALAWDASFDDVGVTRYELTRDGAPLATVNAPATTHTDVDVVPGTTYTYAVRALDAAGNPSPFSSDLVVTVPVADADPVLVGAGDIADCGSGSEATAAVLDGLAGTVFTAGDNAYPTGSAADFTACYQPTWGRHKDRTLPAAGNHDYMTPGASAYFDYFGTAAGDPSTGYYSYDRGTWHIVVLNSNCEVVACDIGSAQEQWLRADLDATPKENIGAIWHHPRYSSGDVHGADVRTQALWQALYDHGAEFVVSAHEHQYERFAPQDPTGMPSSFGIRQFVAGTGGATLYATAPPFEANSEAQHSGHGVLELTLRPDAYDWRFVGPPGTTYTDAGSAPVHGPPPVDSEAPGTPTGLTATAASSTRVDLSWMAPNDNVGVTGYEIERNAAPLASVGAVTTYADTTVTAGQTYTYRVRARDAAANWSDWSSPASATTPIPPPPPSTISIEASEDAYIRPDQAGANFGALTTLLVDASSEKDFLLKFVVSGTAGRTITSARLRLSVVDPSNIGGEFYDVGDSWSEGTVTWGTAPALGSLRVGTLGAVAAGNSYEVDLTSYITGDGTYSLRVTSPSNDGADYVSSEGTSGLRPVLTLNLSGP